MESVQNRGIPAVLDALCLSEADPAVRRLADAFGGDPIKVRERRVGEPGYVSRRLMFASGGEIILHDDAVAAVLLHLTTTPTPVRGIDLAEWVPGVTNDATLDELNLCFARQAHYSRPGGWYFTLDGGYVEFRFSGSWGGWKTPKNLEFVTFTSEKPGLGCDPADDDCPSCSDVLVRRDGADSGVDVNSTIARLSAAISGGLLKEDTHWVRVADLQLLHASRLMERVESQLTCTACRRIICFTLLRDSSPTFGYYALNDAQRRPLEAIPPVESWGDEARIAEDHDAMHYVDHEPGSWFLVEQQGHLYLDARYVISSMADDSALIQLSDAEADRYRAGVHDYISSLAKHINSDGPHRENSPYRERDLFRGPDANTYRESVNRAIVNHTWIARQRRQLHVPGRCDPEREHPEFSES